MENQSLIIDCGPDLDSKCLLQIVKKVDAILFTHEHGSYRWYDDIFDFKQEGNSYLRPSKSD
jgi:hypothetical protein